MFARPLIGITALLLIANSAAAADGAAVYTAQCAKCHGDTGKADTTIGKANEAPASRWSPVELSAVWRGAAATAACH